MTHLNYPLLFEPVYKDYLWGGNRIPKRYGRQVPPGTYAESWEISDRPEGMSVVTNGRFAGRSLGCLVTEFGAKLVGDDFTGKRFPLLIKLIDAQLRLSVQVHPSDENATAVKGDPKTEMWYVLDAKAGGKVFVGFKKAVTRKCFDLAVSKGNLASMLKPVKMGADTAILVPGGTVHCIGEGLLLLEVQQNSNTTFRVYDWDRVGPDGKARPLHVAEAKKSISWSGRTPVRARLRVTAREGLNVVSEVLACRHFRVESLALVEPFAAANDGRSFHALFVANGAAIIRAGRCSVTVKCGTSCLIPASIGKYTISPLSATARVLRITLGRAIGQ